ncbi:MAG: hypothetical protein ACTS9Y_09095 [Methylophilus sp.]|uniref:hypothetical protein n=1 Tax=Methylophilus sp. TaxID=29541 RepID=UPI003F9F8B13
MQNLTLKLAVIGALFVTGQAHAGWVTVPSTGFTGSAYTNCYNAGRTAGNPKGNFGSYPLVAAQYPSTGVSDTCWTSAPSTEVALPPVSRSGSAFSGFTQSAVTTRSIPNPVSGGAVIGQVVDKYWRNPTTNVCLIATRVRMYDVDSDDAANKQLFEVNDVVRSGFSASTNVYIAYAFPSNLTPITVMSPVYRVGRTYTSVQHRALAYNNNTNKGQNGINYLDLPTAVSVNTATSGEATGIDATTTASTSTATQDAVVRSNHVDFTMDAVFADDDGTTNAYSAVAYVEASCDAEPTEQAGAIRLRQTGQENATLKTIDMTGYAISATTP